METIETRLAREGSARQQHWFADLLGRARDGAWERIRALQSELWRRYADGWLTEEQAGYVAAIAEARLKPPASPPSPAGAAPRIRPRETYVGSRPRTEASLVRRRQHLAIGLLPDHFLSCRRWGFFAVLAAIATETIEHGSCRLYVAALGARTGYCDSTVQAAIAWARDRGWIAVEYRRPAGALRNHANVITVREPAWLDWLRRRALTWRGVSKRARAFWGLDRNTGSTFVGASRTRDRSGVAPKRDSMDSAAPPAPILAAGMVGAKPAPS